MTIFCPLYFVTIKLCSWMLSPWSSKGQKKVIFCWVIYRYKTCCRLTYYSRHFQNRSEIMIWTKFGHWNVKFCQNLDISGTHLAFLAKVSPLSNFKYVESSFWAKLRLENITFWDFELKNSPKFSKICFKGRYGGQRKILGIIGKFLFRKCSKTHVFCVFFYAESKYGIKKFQKCNHKSLIAKNRRRAQNACYFL